MQLDKQLRAAFTRHGAKLMDLGEAKRYAEAAELGASSGGDRSDEVTLRALTTALVVAYGRPFSTNRSGEKMAGGRAQIPNWELSPEEKLLNECLLELRNREFAHSDGQVSTVT